MQTTRVTLYNDRNAEEAQFDILVIRMKVKSFAQQTASGRRPDGKPCPPFKIIVLDEADSMTKDAQSALRRTMEKEGRTTRFCLICNYVSRIIEPLTSRCAKFRFRPLAKDVLVQRLEMIASGEKINVAQVRRLQAVQASYPYPEYSRTVPLFFAIFKFI